MIRTAISWLQNAVRKPGGTVMALLIAAALVSPVIMLMANAEHKAALSGTADAGTVYYVTPAGTGDGSSWANAMGSADFAASMDAISKDTSLDVTFYLKKGQYDLTRTLPLTKGVKVYGGFDGTETAPDQRNITAIMSGDNAMSADHATILSRDASVSADVKFSIVTGGADATSADTVLDGVTVTGGNGTEIDGNAYGGGMYNYSSSPTVTNCTFSGNSADNGGYGGAMYNDSSSPTVTNCTFSGNTTVAYGGAMCNFGTDSSSSPAVTNCTFSGNSASSGGAMSNLGIDSNSSPTVTNCTFSGNSASNDYGGDGGAMYNSNTSPTVTNCTFSGNTAGYQGGAIRSSGANPTVTYCSFSGNTASSGGGMYNGDGSSPTVLNCSFSGNSAVYGASMYNLGGSPTVRNCTFSGNSAVYAGGAMYNGNGSSPTVSNCSFSGNFANSEGGAMYNYVSSTYVTNCTFSGNTASSGGGAVYNYDDSSKADSSTAICNTVFWGNSANGTSSDIYNYNRSTSRTVSLDIRYSVIAAEIVSKKSHDGAKDVTVTSMDIVTTDPKLQPLDRSLNALAAGYASTDVYVYAIQPGSSAAKLGLPVGSTVFTSGDIKITVPSDDQTGFTRDTAVSSDAGAYALNVKDLGTIAVTVDPAAVSLARGASANLTLSANISQSLSGLPSAATWSSSAADIATVTGSGAAAVVTAVKKGVADITAAFTIQTGTRIVNGETKSELTGTATSVVTVDGGASSGGGSGCNAGTAASGIALLALCLPMLIKRRKR